VAEERLRAARELSERILTQPSRRKASENLLAQAYLALLEERKVLREAARGLNDAARTLVEQLDQHGLANLALFEQQIGHLRGHLLSEAALQAEPAREGSGTP